MYKYEKQFREENPETVGETDKHFDLSNYKDWLESKLEKLEAQFAQETPLIDKLNIAIEGLERIQSPIRYLQQEAEKSGASLDGQYAVGLSQDYNFLKGLATQTLNRLTTLTSK